MKDVLKDVLFAALILALLLALRLILDVWPIPLIRLLVRNTMSMIWR